MLHQRPTGMLVSDGSLLGNVGFRWVSDGAFRFQMGLRWGMPFSDGSPMKHVKVSYQACQSPMGNVSYCRGMSVFDGSPVRHVVL